MIFRRPSVVYLVEIRADDTTPPNYAYLPHVYDNLDQAKADVEALADEEWGADAVTWDVRCMGTSSELSGASSASVCAGTPTTRVRDRPRLLVSGDQGTECSGPIAHSV